jgi:hypothetical protein
MPLPNNALVLVTDGRKMLFFRNHGDENQIDLRTEAHDEREDRKDREIKTDAPGTRRSRARRLRPHMGRPMRKPISTSRRKTAGQGRRRGAQGKRVLRNDFDAAGDRRAAQGARRAQEAAQGGRAARRRDRQQGNDRPADPRHRGPARRRRPRGEQVDDLGVGPRLPAAASGGSRRDRARSTARRSASRPPARASAPLGHRFGQFELAGVDALQLGVPPRPRRLAPRRRRAERLQVDIVDPASASAFAAASSKSRAGATAAARARRSPARRPRPCSAARNSPIVAPS